jgi:hypothetical protein
VIAVRVVRSLVLASLAAAAAVAGAGERPVHVRFTPMTVPPGQDRLACEYLELPNPAMLDVRRFVVRARPRIHHVAIGAYVGQDRDPQYFSNGHLRDGIGCWVIGPPDMAQHTTGLLGAVRTGAYDIPPGYAVTLLPHQPVSVVTHTFNRSRRPRTTRVRLTVVPADPATVRHHLEPLDALALYFELPPQQKTVHVADFIAPVDVNLAMLASHQHRYGTRVAVNRVVDGVEGEQIYENLSWREPKLAWLDPPVRLRAGERLRVHCEWDNRSDRTLRFGGSANDEMCNIEGYVFRDVDLPPEERGEVGGILWPVTP